MKFFIEPFICDVLDFNLEKKMLTFIHPKDLIYRELHLEDDELVNQLNILAQNYVNLQGLQIKGFTVSDTVKIEEFQISENFGILEKR